MATPSVFPASATTEHVDRVTIIAPVLNMVYITAPRRSDEE
jgi:hypothetical protein